jgi:hypothetical protein
VTSIFVFFVFEPLWARIPVGVLGLALVSIFLSTVYTNWSDLNSGMKIIKTGKIIDVYEEFSSKTIGNPKKTIGKREFYFQIGTIKHKYFTKEFDRDTSSEKDQTDPKVGEYCIGQDVEMHYTKSEYFLKVVLLKDHSRPKPTNTIQAKVKSRTPITSFKPRKWEVNSKGAFFYFLINNILHPVSESLWESCAMGAEVREEGNLFTSNSLNFKVKNKFDEWVNNN